MARVRFCAVVLSYYCSFLCCAMRCHALGHGLAMSQMHALCGRMAAHRGERQAAVSHFRKAAAVAMDGRFHLYAAIVGWGCGGEEGSGIVQAACTAMGRTQQSVLGELRHAGAQFEGGLAAVDVVVVEPVGVQTATGPDLGGGGGGGGGGAVADGPSLKPVPPPGKPPVTRDARPTTPGRRVVV